MAGEVIQILTLKIFFIYRISLEPKTSVVFRSYFLWILFIYIFFSFFVYLSVCLPVCLLLRDSEAPEDSEQQREPDLSRNRGKVALRRIVVAIQQIWCTSPHAWWCKCIPAQICLCVFVCGFMGVCTNWRVPNSTQGASVGLCDVTSSPQGVFHCVHVLNCYLMPAGLSAIHIAE